MKLFDKVSNDVRAALLQLESLSPTSVKWEDNDDANCPITKRMEAFFIQRRRLERGTSVVVHFSRRVDDGQLMTSVSAAHPAYEAWCNIDIWLTRPSNKHLRVAAMHFRTADYNESKRTVMYVHDWIRTKGAPHFLKAREARDAESRSTQQLRDKYKS